MLKRERHRMQMRVCDTGCAAISGTTTMFKKESIRPAHLLMEPPNSPFKLSNLFARSRWQRCESISMSTAYNEQVIRSKRCDIRDNNKLVSLKDYAASIFRQAV